MRVDNILANFEIYWISEGGDTGKGGAEHRDFWLFWLTHNKRNRLADKWVLKVET